MGWPSHGVEMFAVQGPGALQKIDITRQKEDYLEILKQNFKTSTIKSKLGSQFKNWGIWKIIHLLKLVENVLPILKL